MNEAIERLLRRPAAARGARLALTFPFWTSGISKLIDFEAGAAEMARAGLEPAALFNAATVIVQLAGSFLVVAGRHVRLGAAVLAAFTGLTVLLVHHFWIIAEEPFRTIALHTAAEHVGIVGGLLAIAILSGGNRPDGRSAKRPDPSMVVTLAPFRREAPDDGEINAARSAGNEGGLPGSGTSCAIAARISPGMAQIMLTDRLKSFLVRSRPSSRSMAATPLPARSPIS